MEKRVVQISWAALWRVFIFILFAMVIFLSRDLILALFLALVVSSGIEAPITYLERKGIPRTLAVVGIFLFGALFLALLVYFIIPFILVDVSNILSGDNQQLIGRLLAPLQGTAAGNSFSDALNNLAGEYFLKNSSPLDFVSQALGGALLGVTVLISSFYLSLTSDGVERFIRAIFPGTSNDARMLKIYHRARRKIGFWFQSQLLLTLIMGIIVWIALALLGVKHAFVLGIIAGILELMPFVGPIVSGGIAVMIAITTSATLGLSTLVVFLLIQQFEGHVLVPLVTKKAVDLHPVIVIISLLIGFQLSGILGGLVAVPLAAVLQEIVEARSEESERVKAETII
jgi:predicted PurR-regulated permease PerM